MREGRFLVFFVFVGFRFSFFGEAKEKALFEKGVRFRF